MKVSLYQTRENHIFAKKRLFYNAMKNEWISTVVLEEKPACDNFKGFGVAITASSCYELSTMSDEEREAFLTDIYGKDGLDFTVGRVSIGSSDYSPAVYSYCDTPGDTELKTFSIKRDMEYVVPMIREVVKHKPEIELLASPWSPPGWMKTGGVMNHGYMRDKYLDCYGDYFVKFIKAYESEGIKIHAITPQNEPESHQTGKSVACVWSPDSEAKFILKLKDKFNENNIDAEIWMYDHCFIGWPRINWSFEEYPELLNCVDSIALHYYEGGSEMTENIKEAYPDMKWDFTEGGPRLGDNYDTDWVKWSVVISSCLSHGARSFTGWNLMLDEDGGPNIGPFPCGGLATLNSQMGELTYSGQYHAFKHFSKFIKKGAKIYSAKLTEDYTCNSGFPRSISIPVSVLAADNTDGSHVVVLTNPNGEKRQAQYFYDNRWWYIELMPNSVSTLVFEK